MVLMRCDRAVFGRWCGAARLCAVVLCAWAFAGCHAWNPPSYVSPELALGPPPPRANSVLVTRMDRDMVWNQVVDVVDDYFRVEREERVRLVGDLLTEGRLDTYPRGGSTIFEPWNGDSADLYERWESTLQSIRRKAVVRVIPAEAGFLVDVEVTKELEDVPRPETGAISTANSLALRNDNGLRRVTNPVSGPPPTIGWIPQGRDPALEQEILAQIQARLNGQGAPQF